MAGQASDERPEGRFGLEGRLLLAAVVLLVAAFAAVMALTAPAWWAFSDRDARRLPTPDFRTAAPEEAAPR